MLSGRVDGPLMSFRVLEGCRCGGVQLLPQRPCENVAFPIGFWLPPLQTSPWRGGVPPRVLILRVGARILHIEPSIYLQCPREALGPHGGKHCGVSWIARVLHLGSTLRLATGAPARGGVRLRPTLAEHPHPKTFILHRFYKVFGSHLGGSQNDGFTNGF